MKNKPQKLLAVLLAAVLTLTALPVTAFAAASITGVTAAGGGSLSASGGSCVITIDGTDLDDGSPTYTVTAFDSTDNPTSITGTATGSDTSKTATLTFPANTLASNYFTYTVKVSTDGGSNWDGNTATVTVANANFTITSVTPAETTMASTGGNNRITLTGVGLDAYSGASYVLGAFLGTASNPRVMKEITPAVDGTSAAATLIFPANNSGSDQVYTIKYSGNYGTSSTTWETTACTVTVPANITKTVSVRTQINTLTAGTAGTVAFPVTTTDIANGNYTVTVANLPAGVTVQGNVTISNNVGGLTLHGNTNTVAGIYNNLSLTIDGATSAAFTLTIDTPTFVPVTGITGVPTIAAVGVGRSLSGTVNPSNATNKAIFWSVKDAGTTGATVTGNTLDTTAVGTAVVTATIADGSAVGTPYTQDFSIAVSDTIPTHTIQAWISGTGGSISPSGDVRVYSGDDITFTITADSGYRISTILVDGTDIFSGDHTSYTYTFTNVTSDHGINAMFTRVSTGNGNNNSGSGSDSGDTYTVVSPAEYTVTKAEAEKLVKEAQDKGHIKISFSGKIFITKEAWEVFAEAGITTEGGRDVITLADALAAYNANPSTDNIHALLYALFTPEGLALAEDNPELAEALAWFYERGARTFEDALRVWGGYAEQWYRALVVNGVNDTGGLYITYIGDYIYADNNGINPSERHNQAVALYNEYAAEGRYEEGVRAVMFLYQLAALGSDTNKTINGKEQLEAEIAKVEESYATAYDSGRRDADISAYVERINYLKEQLENGNYTITASDYLARKAVEAERFLGQGRSNANAPINALAAALGKILGDPSGAVVEVNTTGSPVQVRVTVYQPGKMKTGMYVSGAVKGSTVNSVKATYNKYFTNDVRVISLDYKGEWGQVVRVAAKVDLTAWQGDKPVYFYAYDKEANTYRRIINAAPRLDANGYLHFNTQYGGEIIVSEGELTKKAGVSGTVLKDVTPALVPLFTDTVNHWAKDDIDYVARLGLISGVSATEFSPDTAITRADFLVALGKLAGSNVSGYTASSFTDVSNTSAAMPYIEWAVKNKIVQGIGNNKFGPDNKITREDMAVMMTGYAKATGCTLPVSNQAVAFADDGSISAYAKDAVKAIQQAGIIVGKTGNLFDPQGSATRAEASTILRRFVELVIDGGAASN